MMVKKKSVRMVRRATRERVVMSKLKKILTGKSGLLRLTSKESRLRRIRIRMKKKVTKNNNK